MTRTTRSQQLAGGLLLAAVAMVSGCKTIGFYAQAAKGQYQLLARARPIQKLLTDTNAPSDLKQRLELVQSLRHYAEAELRLPVNGHYRKYVDVHRPFVVWNVQAAPELSMEPKRWWYPLVGSLDYRGYFSRPAATNYAAFLRKKGYDVTVGGVQAYSTLGWFKDPVLNTFIFESEAVLAEILFHELAHQRVFARGDTSFNEAFATTVGQEGARRWLKAKHDAAGISEYDAYLQRNTEIVRLAMATRARLQGLFGDECDEDGKLKAKGDKHTVAPRELRRGKQEIYADLKRSLQGLKAKWNGPSEYDSWFDMPINNAHLNSVAAYFDLVPGFEQLLALNGGDFGRFYDAVERLAKQPKHARHERLRTLARSAAERPLATPPKLCSRLRGRARRSLRAIGRQLTARRRSRIPTGRSIKRPGSVPAWPPGSDHWRPASAADWNPTSGCQGRGLIGFRNSSPGPR